jgi:hypothetical protein
LEHSEHSEHSGTFGTFGTVPNDDVMHAIEGLSVSFQPDLSTTEGRLSFIEHLKILYNLAEDKICERIRQPQELLQKWLNDGKEDQPQVNFEEELLTDYYEFSRPMSIQNR